MGKNRRKNSKEVEYLKGEIRRLRRQIKDLSKQKGISETSQAEEYEPIQLVECTECGKGIINLILSMDRMDIFECNVCDFRKTVKKE
jgi:hypothetical protein